MERLTVKDSNGNYKIEVEKLEYWCTSGDGKKTGTVRGQHIDRLAEYEDLEERLQSVYGECVGLLEKVVGHLERHEGINFQNPAIKAKLLTDEEVDRWEELQQYQAIGTAVCEPEYLGENVPIGCRVGQCKCGNIVRSYQKFCDECGIKLDWGQCTAAQNGEKGDKEKCVKY